MSPRPAWKRARSVGLILVVVALVFSVISWVRDGAPFDTGVGLALTAALVALVVSLYFWSQSRSTDRHR